MPLATKLTLTLSPGPVGPGATKTFQKPPSVTFPETEAWRPVVGWEDRYRVSDLGGVRTAAGRRIAQHLCSFGYPQVSLYRPGSGRSEVRRVHVLVAEAFIGSRVGLVVNHKDNVKTNGALANLELVTQAENVRHGLALHGGRFCGSCGRRGHYSTTCPSSDPRLIADALVIVATRDRMRSALVPYIVAAS